MRKSYLILLISIIHLGAFSEAFASKPIAFYLKSISIEGKTNVNYFEFIYTRHNEYTKEIEGVINHQDHVTFHIPINRFESDNPHMTKDFKELLKHEKYPQILVNINKSQLIDIANGKDKTKLDLNLFLAGETNPVHSKYKRAEKNNKVIVEGETQINLKSFNLNPPKKMLGLIQVQDTILIKFDVVLIKQYVQK